MTRPPVPLRRLARRARPARAAVRRAQGARRGRPGRAGRRLAARRAARPDAARRRRAPRARRAARTGPAGCAGPPQRRGDLGGTLDQVRAALDQALAAEQRDAGRDGRRRRPAGRDGPRDAARRHRRRGPRARLLRLALADEARATFEAIKEMLQREVLDAQFAGMKRFLEDGDPEAMQAVKDMLADLNDLLAAHARGEDTTDRFREFMDKHGDLFPEKPENVDELIDALARRQAAADRMMASLRPEQREQLAPADEPGAVRPRPRLADGAALGQPAGAAARSRPRAGADGRRRAAGLQRRRRGGRRPGRPRGARAAARRVGLRLARSTTSTSTPSRSSSAREAAADLRALRELERELERQGFVSHGRRRAAADAARGTPAGRDRAEAGLRPDPGRRAPATTTTGVPARPTSPPG